MCYFMFVFEKISVNKFFLDRYLQCIVVPVDETVPSQIPTGKILSNTPNFYNHAVSFYRVKHRHV